MTANLTGVRASQDFLIDSTWMKMNIVILFSNRSAVYCNETAAVRYTHETAAVRYTDETAAVRYTDDELLSGLIVELVSK